MTTITLVWKNYANNIIKSNTIKDKITRLVILYKHNDTFKILK